MKQSEFIMKNLMVLLYIHMGLMKKIFGLEKNLVADSEEYLIFRNVKSIIYIIKKLENKTIGGE